MNYSLTTISIPSGTIKRLHRYKPKRLLENISIPSGTIKSFDNVSTEELYKISIPSGTIKSINAELNSIG